MKIEKFQIIKETEKASLIKTFIENLDSEKEFWIPKSKYEMVENILEIEDDVWNKKLEELSTPQEIESIIVYVSEFETQDKATKITLSLNFKNSNTKSWLFVPNSLVLDKGELDTDEKEKFWFKIPTWFWDKSTNELKQKQLEFFNKDREEDELLKKKDFKITNKLEE